MGISSEARYEECRKLVDSFIRDSSSSRVGAIWAGGADGLFVLELVHEVSENLADDLPHIAVLDEGPFASGQVTSSAELLADELDVEVTILRNDGFLDLAASGGKKLELDRLAETERLYLERSDFAGEVLRFDRDFVAIRTLTRRLPAERWIRARSLRALVSEVRWESGDGGERLQRQLLMDGEKYDCLRPLSRLDKSEILQLVASSESEVWDELPGCDRLDREVLPVPGIGENGSCEQEDGGDGSPPENPPEDQEAIIDQLRGLGYI